MGVPLVKTKLMAYATGAAFGGMAGRLPRRLPQHGQRRPVPVRLLDLHPRDGHPRRPGLDLGGGARRGRRCRSSTPTSSRTCSTACRRKIGLDFDLTQLSFGIFGFLIVLMMVLRPAGPAARAKAQARAHRGHRRPTSRVYEARRERRRRHDRADAAPSGDADPRGRRTSRKIFGGLVAVNDVTFSIPRSGRSSRSSGPTAPARRRSSTCSPGLYKPTTGRIVLRRQGHHRQAAGPDHWRWASRGRSRTSACSPTMSALENVMVGQHARMKAGLFGSIFRPPWVRRGGARPSREQGARDARLRRPRPAHPRRARDRTSPTATSAGSRSPARSPPSPSCCCSTSRRRG